jgi:hypothetical protein
MVASSTSSAAKQGAATALQLFQLDTLGYVVVEVSDYRIT